MWQLVHGFCPEGFHTPDGLCGNTHFPHIWHIPIWTDPLPRDKFGQLKTVTLSGFAREGLNRLYLEGPTPEFQLQGQKTYWTQSGEYYLFFCEKFKKWRVGGASSWVINVEGACSSFVSDIQASRDILNETLSIGWAEIVNTEWSRAEAAGVVALGTLADLPEDTGYPRKYSHAAHETAKEEIWEI